MTVTAHTAYDDLRASVRRLRETAAELRLFAVEDHPRDQDVHLVGMVHDSVLALSAEAEHADAALNRSASRSDSGSASVLRCQAHVIGFGALLARGLGGPDYMTDLLDVGTIRGPETRAWAGEIVRCVQACQHVLWTDVEPQLLAYWNEMAALQDRPPSTRTLT